MEFRLRDDAAFFYETGAGLYSLMSGSAGFFGYALGIQGAAIYENAADNWVYLPVPHDWNGGFVLPVLSNQPLELVSRDIATGWVLARNQHDPVLGGGLIDVGPLGNDHPRRPQLVDARPFQLVHLPAPEPGDLARLTLDVVARSNENGAVQLEGIQGLPVATGTTVALYDFAPTSPLDPEATPAEPIAGPSFTVCEPKQPWHTGSLAGSDDMLAVIGPGDVDAASLDRLELQFDQPLLDVTQRPVAEVARLPTSDRSRRATARRPRATRRRSPSPSSKRTAAAGWSSFPPARCRRPPLPPGDRTRRRSPCRRPTASPAATGDTAPHPLRLRHPRRAGRADVAACRRARRRSAPPASPATCSSSATCWWWPPRPATWWRSTSAAPPTPRGSAATRCMNKGAAVGDPRPRHRRPQPDLLRRPLRLDLGGQGGAARGRPQGRRTPCVDPAAVGQRPALLPGRGRARCGWPTPWARPPAPPPRSGSAWARCPRGRR